MTERVVLALRELADALEELSEREPGTSGGASLSVFSALQTVVRPTSSTSPPRSMTLGSGRASTAGREPNGSSVQYHTDVRLYLVLSNPRRPDVIGLYSGQWKFLEEQLAGGRLSGSEARLRKVESQEQAERMWADHFPNRAMPMLTL